MVIALCGFDCDFSAGQHFPWFYWMNGCFAIEL